MDPLTLTSTVIGLVLKSVDAIQKLNNFHSKWENLPLDLLSLEGQCDAVSFALHQIHDALQKSPHVAKALTTEQDISSKTFAKVMASCEVRFHVMANKLDQYVSQAFKAEFPEMGFRGKAKLMWKDNGIQSASRNLSLVVEGLNLVFQALNLKSSLELQNMLSDKRNSAIVDDMAADAISIASSDRVSVLLEPGIAGEDESPSSRQLSQTRISQVPTADLTLARLALAEASLTRSGGVSCFVSHADADFVVRVAEAEEAMKKDPESGFTLDLSRTSLRFVHPHWIELVCSRLERFALSRNSLQSLPSELKTCTRLRSLSLQHNSFRIFPQCIFELPTLEVLDLSHNRIQTIPEQILRLQSLKALGLRDNPISKLPSAIGHLQTLKLIGVTIANLSHPMQILVSKIILPWAYGFDDESQRAYYAQNRKSESPKFCSKLKELLRVEKHDGHFELHWCLKCSTLFNYYQPGSFLIFSLGEQLLSAEEFICDNCNQPLRTSSTNFVAFEGRRILCDTCIQRPSCKVCMWPEAKWVRALYNYSTEDRGSLSFRAGDVIQVITELESGWWDGIISGVRGWFPSNYCRAITSPEEDSDEDSLSQDPEDEDDKYQIEGDTAEEDGVN